MITIKHDPNGSESTREILDSVFNAIGTDTIVLVKPSVDMTEVKSWIEESLDLAVIWNISGQCLSLEVFDYTIQAA